MEKSVKYFLGGVIVVVLLVFIFTGDVALVGGIGLAVILGFLIYFKQANESWSGEIIELFDKEYVKNEGEFNSSKKVRYARIRMSNGKVKKKAAYPDWKVGDKLVKEKGTTQIVKK